MNSCQLTMSVTALANAIAKGLSDDEISLLAAILTQLGDTLATISAQREFCESLNAAARSEHGRNEKGKGTF